MRRTLPVLLSTLALGLLLQAQATAQPATVRVPRVVGLRVHEAERRIVDAGLTVRLIGRGAGEGVRIVTAQKPAPGERARVGAQVRVTWRWSAFGAPPPSAPRQARKVRVPKVTGLRLREAVRRLERAGLGADAIGPTAGRGGRALVVGQHPASGQVVSRRATIRITWRHTR